MFFLKNARQNSKKVFIPKSLINIHVLHNFPSKLLFLVAEQYIFSFSRELFLQEFNAPAHKMHPPSPLKKCDAKRMRISKKTFPD